MPASPWRTVALTIVASLTLATTAISAQQYVPPEEMDAQTVYGFSCAACHGTDGGGLSPDNPLFQSFESSPADFSDPLFNSREPAADWVLVVTHGGASIGLSDEMPAFGEAFSNQQIVELVAYLKQLVDTSRYPPGELNFIRPIGTIKAFPEDEALLINRYVAGDDGAPDSLRSTLYYGWRIGARHQAEIKVAHIDEDGVSELDEAEIGWKWAVRDNLEALSLYTLGLEAAFPIADDNASEEIIPYFSFAKGLSDALTLQGTLKAKLPVDDADAGEAALSAVLHWMRSPWPRSSTPALEATLTSPFSGGESHATLTPQVYFGLSKLGHVALALGVEVPLTDLDYEYRIHSFLLWDVAAGPIWDFW